MKHFIKISFFILICLLFVRCAFLPTKSTSKIDEVLNVERHRYDAIFSQNELHEQEYTQKISFLKEKNDSGQITYTLYDIITLPYNSFDLSEKSYIVIDKKVFELPNTVSENSNHSKLKNKTETILKADSSKVDIVTGYNQEYLKTYKMTHPLSNEIVERILNANYVYLRYYAGPNQITSEIGLFRLDALKKTLQK